MIEIRLDFLDTCFYFGLSMSPMRCFVYTTLPLDCAFSQRPLEPAVVLLPCIYHVCCLAYRAVAYDIYIYIYIYIIYADVRSNVMTSCSFSMGCSSGLATR